MPGIWSNCRRPSSIPGLRGLWLWPGFSRRWSRPFVDVDQSGGPGHVPAQRHFDHADDVLRPSKTNAPEYGRNSRDRFSMANIGVAINAYEGSGSLVSLNIGFGYNRLADLNYDYSFQRGGQRATVGDVYSRQLYWSDVSKNDFYNAGGSGNWNWDNIAPPSSGMPRWLTAGFWSIRWTRMIPKLEADLGRERCRDGPFHRVPEPRFDQGSTRCRSAPTSTTRSISARRSAFRAIYQPQHIDYGEERAFTIPARGPTDTAAIPTGLSSSSGGSSTRA